ncbi:MAG: polysaccharide biosynthesis/export family protein, partial [Bacteroidota bacterium]
MNKRKLLIFWAVLLLASGCASEREVTTNVSAERSRSATGAIFVKMHAESYIIRQGDAIELSVWGYPEFNISTTVKKGGTILIPLIGEVRAEGKTKEQFLELLSSQLSQYIQGEPRVSISVSSPTLQRVAVLGAVVRQDNYPVTGDVSLVEILSTAGGTTAESDLH